MNVGRPALRSLQLRQHASSFQAPNLWSLQRWSSSTANTVKEGDIVLLEAPSRREQLYFTNPLRHGSSITNHHGSLAESEIIGLLDGDSVTYASKKNSSISARVKLPTLQDYVRLSPREVTPIYAQDCNLIVSLLDIHAQPPIDPDSASQGGPDLRILEAGTGHGSLTLHLARAIQAANPPVPEAFLGFPPTGEEGLKSYQASLAEWKAKRRAVIHTVELSPKNSKVAQRTVNNFRRGLYAPHIDFHVDGVSEFIDSQMSAQSSSTSSQLYDHIILDLPSTPTHLSSASRVLKHGGSLLVFCPSITQIAQCVRMMREQDLPLAYETVLELGAGMVGGKQWDVRMAKIRNPDMEKKGGRDAGAKVQDAGLEAGMPLGQRIRRALAIWLMRGLKHQNSISAGDTESKSDAEPQERWEMVARPSVGHRVAGGGFLGVWRRRRVKEAATS